MSDFHPLDEKPAVVDRVGRRCGKPAPEGVDLACVLPEDHFTEHAAAVYVEGKPPAQWYGWTA